MDFGNWTENDRSSYNKWDAISRSTVEVCYSNKNFVYGRQNWQMYVGKKFDAYKFLRSLALPFRFTLEDGLQSLLL